MKQQTFVVSADQGAGFERYGKPPVGFVVRLPGLARSA
jgi:hypothetical protein